MIGAITEGLAFDGSTYKKSSLGGSETAFTMMMQHLAKRGHEVFAFTKCENPGNHDGVIYEDVTRFETVSPTFEWDVLFIYRHYAWAIRPSHARLRILVNHDIMVPEGKSQFMANLWQTDMLFNLSEYHKEQYCESLPELRDHIWVTKNGIDIATINKTTKNCKKNMKKFIWGSRPERGLDVLLKDIWPRLHQADPQRELYIAGYDLGKGLRLPEHMLNFYEYTDHLVETTPGVVRLGPQKKEGWYKHMAESALMLYPTNFAEIFCINAVESQACNTPVVTTMDFSLRETVGQKRCLVMGNNTSKDYQDTYIDRVEFLLSNLDTYKQVQQTGQKHIQQYDWPVVALEWEEKLLQTFEKRYQNNKHWVFKSLLYNSDVLLARQMAEEAGMQEELEEATAIIDRAMTMKDEYAGDDPEVLLTVSSDLTRIARVPILAAEITPDIHTLLEIGCHFGEHSIGCSNIHPHLKAIATDFSPACIHQAQNFVDQVAKHPENIELRVRDWRDALDPDEPRVDAVFAGEVMEHVDDPYAFIDTLESYVKPGGKIIFTVPQGPWEAWGLKNKLDYVEGENRFHLSDFRFRDIHEVFSKKRDMRFFCAPKDISGRGELVGNWVIVYTAAASPTGRIDPRRKFLTTRPYRGISTCIIVGNEEANIQRCLESVKDFSDEMLVIGTPSCKDASLEIAVQCGASVGRVGGDHPDTPEELIKKFGPGDFGFWRNASIESAQYPWILWLDADEVLTGGQGMFKYLNSPVFNGYVIRQHHLCIDMSGVVPDVPIRLFKNGEGYRFYGCIHEHCQINMNDPISPAYQLEDVNLAHFGYITEQHRRHKCYQRNLNLLLKDRVLNPDRTLGWILLQRDYHNFISLRLEESKGQIDEDIVKWLQSIYGIHREHFLGKESNIYYKLSYVLYQKALAMMGQEGIPLDGVGSRVPFEVGLWLGGGVGGITTDTTNGVAPKRVWFADKEEYQQFLDKMSTSLMGALQL
jgi:glycosyltransferase involved in cell wall biosynthesis/SAM-dependent methyltransferase